MVGSVVQRYCSALRALFRQGLGWLLLFVVLGGLCNFLAQTLLGLFLEPAQVGQFGNILAQANIAASIAGLGMFNFWYRINAEQSVDDASSWYRGGIHILLATTGLVFIAFVLFGAWQGAVLAYLLIGTQIPGRVYQQMLGAGYQILERRLSFAALQAWPYVIRILLTLAAAAILARLPWADAVKGFAIGHAIAMAITLVILHRLARDFGNRRLKGVAARPDYKGIWSGTAPFFTTDLVFLAHTQAGVIIASELINLDSGGHYFLANAFALAAMTVTSTIYQRFFVPQMYVRRREDPAAFVSFFTKGLAPAALFAGASLLGMIGASLLVVPIFGESYGETARLVALLGVVVALRTMRAHCSALLVTGEDIEYRARTQVRLALPAIAGMALGAVTLGTLGIVYAAILFEFAMFALLFVRARAAVHAVG